MKNLGCIVDILYCVPDVVRVTLVDAVLGIQQVLSGYPRQRHVGIYKLVYSLKSGTVKKCITASERDGRVVRGRKGGREGGREGGERGREGDRKQEKEWRKRKLEGPQGDYMQSIYISMVRWREMERVVH